MTVLLNEIEELYNSFSKAAYEPRYLDRKTKELIAFSNSVIINCKHCMKHHLKAALKEGATKEEIAESVALAMSVSAGKIRGVARDIVMENTLNE